MNSLQGQLHSLTTEYTQRVVSIVQKAISDAVSSSLHTSAAAKAATPHVAKKRGRPAKAKPVHVAAPPAAPAKKAAKASKRAKGAKRAPEEIAQTTTALHAYVKAHAGQRIEQIAKGMKVSTKDLALPAKKLLGDRKMKTKGQKRATQYFPS